MKHICACALTLLLAGCGTSVHDMLYYPPVDDRDASTIPPSAYAPAPLRRSEPPLEHSYAPPPEVARAEPPPPTVHVPPAPPDQPPAAAPRSLPQGSEGQVAVEPAPPPAPAAVEPASPDAQAAVEPAPPAAQAFAIPPPAEVTQPAAPASLNAHCDAVAHQRADDGAANGLDEETQKSVYSGTYASCLAWTSSHGME